MTQLKCGVPDEITTHEIKRNFQCTKVVLPCIDNVKNIERDKFKLKKHEDDVAILDLVDTRNGSKLKIVAKQILALKVT